jgi:hypothetical protein
VVTDLSRSTAADTPRLSSYSDRALERASLSTFLTARIDISLSIRIAADSLSGLPVAAAGAATAPPLYFHFSSALPTLAAIDAPDPLVTALKLRDQLVSAAPATGHARARHHAAARSEPCTCSSSHAFVMGSYSAFFLFVFQLSSQHVQLQSVLRAGAASLAGGQPNLKWNGESLGNPC